MEAGKIVCDILDDDPGAIDKIVKGCPSMTPEMVVRFEQIGRKQLHPSLLIFEGHGPDRLARLPFAVQEKYSKEPVPLLVKTDSGWDTLNVDIRNLTKAQSEQVFSREGVRSEAAQRAWIEDKAAKKHAPPARANLPWRISGHSVVFMEPCTLTRRELAKILAEAE